MAKRSSSHGYEHVAAEEQRREWERTKQELALTKRKLMESEELVLQLKTATRKLEETMRKRDKDLQRVFAVLRAPPDDQLTQTRKQELIERLVMDTQQRAVHAEALAEQRKKELDRLHFSSKFLRQRELEVELEECHLEIARLRASLERDRQGDRSNQLHDAAKRHSPKQPPRSASAESVRRTAPTHEPNNLRPTDGRPLTVHETVAPGIQVLKPSITKPKKESFVTKTRRRALEAEYFKQVRLAQLEAECELSENLHIRAAREAKAHRQAELLIQRQKQQAEQEERIAREREERLALELRQQVEQEERIASEREVRLALEHKQRVGAALAVVTTQTPTVVQIEVPVETTRDDTKDAGSINKPDTDPAQVLMTELNAAGESKADTVVAEELHSDERRSTAEEGIQVPGQASSAPVESAEEHQKTEEAIPKDVSDDEDPHDDVSVAAGNSNDPQAADADEVGESMEAEHQERAEPAAAPHYEEDFKDEDDESFDVEHHETAEDVARTAPLYEDDEFEENYPSNPQYEPDPVVVDPVTTHNGFAFERPADGDAESEVNPEPRNVHPNAPNVENRADASVEEGEMEHEQGFVVDIKSPPVAEVSNAELLQTSDSPTVGAEEPNAPRGFAVDVEPPIEVVPGPGLSDATSRDGNAAPESDPVQGFLVPVEYSAGAGVDPIATEEKPVERSYYEQTQPVEAAEHRPHGFQGLLDHVGGALDRALDVCEQLVETAGESIEQHVTAAGHSMAQSLQHTQEAAANAIQRLWRRRQPREPPHNEAAHADFYEEPAEAESPHAEIFSADPHEEPYEAEPAQAEPSPSPVDTARTTTTNEYSGFSDDETP